MIMLDTIIQTIGLISSVTAIYLGFHDKIWIKRLGALIGLLIATPTNLYLTYNGPWSVFMLTIIVGLIYIKSVNLPDIWRKL